MSARARLLTATALLAVAVLILAWAAFRLVEANTSERFYAPGAKLPPWPAWSCESYEHGTRCVRNRDF